MRVSAHQQNLQKMARVFQGFPGHAGLTGVQVWYMTWPGLPGQILASINWYPQYYIMGLQACHYYVMGLPACHINIILAWYGQHMSAS